MQLLPDQSILKALLFFLSFTRLIIFSLSESPNISTHEIYVVQKRRLAYLETVKSCNVQ